MSIGIDEISNSLVVSAPAYLFDEVTKMINDLDKSALPDYTVKLVPVGQGIGTIRMKELLDEVYMQQQPENRPGQARPATKSLLRPNTAKPAAGSH